MIRHWLTLAWRTLRSDPAFAAISILSLAIGCAGALLVGGYLREELTFDHWVPASDRIVRLDTNFTPPGREPQRNTFAPSGVGFLLREQLPGLESMTRISQNPPLSVRSGETTTSVFAQFVDPNHLQVIELPLAEGDPATALADPSGVVISPTIRDQLFGEGPALGKTIALADRDVEAVVTGVIGELPRNTQFRNAQLLASHDSPLKPPQQSPPPPPSQPGQPAPPAPPPPPEFDSTFFFNATVYLRATSVEEARAWRDTLPALAQEIFEENRPAQFAPEATVSFSVTPLRDMYLSPGPNPAQGGVVARLQLFAAIAAALLFVSAFNYVSLSLARVVRRTREVGLRKAMGATRGDLMRQHLAESAVFTIIALLIGFGLAELLLPFFSRELAIGIDARALHHPVFLVLALAGGAILAMLVAANPALFLARVKPASILQGRTGSTRALAGAVFALVAVQFVAATALVTAVAVFHAQARFLASADLGFEPEDRFMLMGGGVIFITGPNVAAAQAETNLSRLRQLQALLADEPSVISVSGSSLPVFLGLNAGAFDNMRLEIRPLESDDEAGRAMPALVEFGWFETMGLRLIAGRTFSEDQGLDRVYLDNPGAQPTEVPAVVTRAFLPLVDARTPEEALGRRARYVVGAGPQATIKEFEIVGVLEDMRFQSLRAPAGPMLFLPNPGGASILSARVDGAQREAAQEAIQAALAEVYATATNNVNDMTIMAEGMYQEDRRWRRLVTAVALLAVGVACLGLYGLTAFSASQRRLEVGVRKSLGADQDDVLKLMLLRFVRPVMVGIALGWLIAWYAMSDWLSGYATRVALTPIPFLIAGAAALVVALATVIFHALRSARLNPATVLRQA